MDTLHTFKPTLDGPATMKAPTCRLPCSDSDPRVIDDNGIAATEDGDFEDSADATENGAGAATEQADASVSPLDLPAEFLIGIQEEDAHDPVDLMIVFQKNLELVQEAGKRIHNFEQRRVQAKGTEEAADAAIALAAEKAKHGAALVDLRKLAQKMGGDYHQRMTDALASARMVDGKANTPSTLHIRSGKPVNTFEAAAWPAAFVEFFYGDCAPNLARPQKAGLRELFHYLATREELEYSLEADKDDPLIPDGCYRAPSQSRWNTPEFIAIFADVVRKLRILQTTKHMWEQNAPKWRIDISDMRSESGTFRAIGSHPRATRPTEHDRDDASSRRTQIASIVQSIAVRDLPDCEHSTDTRLQDEPQTVWALRSTCTMDHCPSFSQPTSQTCIRR